MLDKTLQDAIVNKGRSFLRGVDLSDPIGAAFVSDQELRLPQPPLVKAAAAMPETHIRLPEPESTPLAESDLTELLRSRRSCRGYGDAPLTLQQLSYLLCVLYPVEEPVIRLRRTSCAAMWLVWNRARTTTCRWSMRWSTSER